MPSISKEAYVTRNFQKISGKRWELYVITRVIHLLNDPDIEYVCQQYIKPPKNEGHYLADLAFPSLRLYLEIDEGQHGNQDHKLSDIKRDAEILEATDWQCQRIAIFVEQGNTKVDKKLEVLNKEIDDFVQYVRNRKQNLISQGNSISWNYEEKYLPETFIKQQIINVKDNVALLNHRDVLRLFGYTKGHYQRAVWTIDNFHEIVWFPKLYPNADWVNEFNEESIKDQDILNLASKVNYEIDPENEYPNNYTGTLICETSEGTITENQNCFRGGKKQPLTNEDIQKKYNANLKFSKLNEDEQSKLTKFTDNFFKQPSFENIDFKS